MPLNIRSAEVTRLAGKLAARQGTNKTEAVKRALENELRRIGHTVPLRERVKIVIALYASAEGTDGYEYLIAKCPVASLDLSYTGDLTGCT